jgi:hypothetical protein
VIAICPAAINSISYLDDSPLQNGFFDEHLIFLPFNVLITGDLAFLSTLLGKENMPP